MRRHWYYVETWVCPVCGREKTYRERRYGTKPKKYWDTHRYVQHYDWCDVLVL